MAPVVPRKSLLFGFIHTYGFSHQRICQSILPCLGFWGLFLQRDQIALALEEESKHECPVSFHCECKWKFCFSKDEYAQLPMFGLDECTFSLFPLWHQCTTMRPYPDYELHNTLESSGLSNLRKSLYVCNVKHPCCGQFTEGSLTLTRAKKIQRARETVREKSDGERGWERERVLVEPIRCWPHLFAPRLLTIYLWSTAVKQPCGNGWDAVELFCRVSHETFQRAPNTLRH